jgi:hypothetical protein
MQGSPFLLVNRRSTAARLNRVAIVDLVRSRVAHTPKYAQLVILTARW